jgi:hypothetical protein
MEARSAVQCRSARLSEAVSPAKSASVAIGLIVVKSVAKSLLLQFLELRVNGKPQERAPADLARFAGTIRLPQDPLAWQQRVRGEWS